MYCISNQSSNLRRTRRPLYPRLPRLLTNARRLEMERMRYTASVGLLRLPRMVFNPRLHKNSEGSHSRNKMSNPPTVHPRGLMWKKPMSHFATQITNRLPRAVPSIHCPTAFASGSDLTTMLLVQKPCQAPLA
ncbi:unnamed protein product, partial [Ectocarpus sp. 12 AP-2014]